MIGGVKSWLSKMAAAVATTMVAALSAVCVASGASKSLPPEYTEMLRLAQDKVNAASQPGAIGNGIPFLNADLGRLFPWIGFEIAAAFMALFAARFLMPRLKNEIIAQ